MKKIGLILLSLVAMMTLVACDNNTVEVEDETTKKTEQTTPPTFVDSDVSTFNLPTIPDVTEYTVSSAKKTVKA